MKQRDEKKETRKLPMSRRGKRFMVIYAVLVLMMTAGVTTAFAADDPLTVINNLWTSAQSVRFYLRRTRKRQIHVDKIICAVNYSHNVKRSGVDLRSGRGI